MASTPQTGVMGWLFRLFDVDTVDVVERLTVALNPLNGREFLTGTLDGELGSILGTKWPDLWGPVWIYQTSVFALFFSTTVAGMLFSFMQGVRYEYSIEILTSASFALALFQFGGPILVWVAVQFFNVSPQLTLAQTLCLFGYANAIWIPIVLLEGSLPSGLIGDVAATVVRWVFAAIGTAASAAFVLRNLRRALQLSVEGSGGVPKATLIMACAGLLQLAIGALVATTVSAATK